MKFFAFSLVFVLLATAFATEVTLDDVREMFPGDSDDAILDKIGEHFDLSSTELIQLRSAVEEAADDDSDADELVEVVDPEDALSKAEDDTLEQVQSEDATQAEAALDTTRTPRLLKNARRVFRMTPSARKLWAKLRTLRGKKLRRLSQLIRNRKWSRKIQNAIGSANFRKLKRRVARYLKKSKRTKRSRRSRKVRRSRRGRKARRGRKVRRVRRVRRSRRSSRRGRKVRRVRRSRRLTRRQRRALRIRRLRNKKRSTRRSLKSVTRKLSKLTRRVRRLARIRSRMVRKLQRLARRGSRFSSYAQRLGGFSGASPFGLGASSVFGHPALNPWHPANIASNPFHPLNPFHPANAFGLFHPAFVPGLNPGVIPGSIGANPGLFGLLHPSALTALANPYASMSPFMAPGVSVPQMQMNPYAAFNPYAPFAPQQQQQQQAAPKGGKADKKGAKAQSALQVAADEATAEGAF